MTEEEPISFYKEIKCEMLTNEYELQSSHWDNQIIISNLGTKPSNLYEVKTRCFNWEVIRKIDDFKKLRTSLCRIFPNIVIPPL
jgi:hypothetical protein